MSFLGGLLDPVISIADTVIDRLVVDKNAAAQIKNEIEKELAVAHVQGNLAQLEVNKVEAAHKSIFVAGWRPFIGWTCGIAMAFTFVIAPIGGWVAVIAGYEFPPPPMLDESLWGLIFGMLGLGTLRTYEKRTGVAREQ
jgi:hypothetical protein